MDTPFHFGILPMLHTAFQLFEENNRGKARTELTIQAMKPGDYVLVYGREAIRNFEDRLRDKRLDAYVIPVGREHIEFPEHLHEKLTMRFRGKAIQGHTLHVDHTFVTAWMEHALNRMNHDFKSLVGMIGDFNLNIAAPELPAPSWNPRR